MVKNKSLYLFNDQLFWYTI